MADPADERAPSGDNPVAGTIRSSAQSVPLIIPDSLGERFEPASLPDFERYEKGAEASIGGVRSLHDHGNLRKGDLYVLKLYNKGIDLDREIIGRLMNAETDHVVRLLEADRVGDQWYEIQEYVPGGSLRDLFNAGRNVDPDGLFDELLSAIRHIGSLGIFHRDIKPANILIRSEKPKLDIVLADFGLAALGDQSIRFDALGHSLVYSPPEAAFGAANDSRDYWSLGMIMLRVLTGKLPFGLTDEKQIAYLLSQRAVPLDDIEDPRTKLLLAGLLTRSVEHRWANEEVVDWQAGESPPTFFHLSGEDRSVKFNKGDYATFRDVAAAMAADWEAGTSAIAHNWLTDQALEEPRDFAVLQIIDDAEQKRADLDARLFQIITDLDPSLPPSFRGYALNEAGLLALADHALTPEDSGEGFGSRNHAQQTVMKLFDGRLLSYYGDTADSPGHQRWDSAWQSEVTELRRIESLATSQDAPRISDDLTPTIVAHLLAATISPKRLNQLRRRGSKAIGKDADNVGWFDHLDESDGPASVAVLRLLWADDINRETGRILREQKEERDRVREERREARRRWRRPVVHGAIAIALIATLPALAAFQDYLDDQADLSPMATDAPDGATQGSVPAPPVTSGSANIVYAGQLAELRTRIDELIEVAETTNEQWDARTISYGDTQQSLEDLIDQAAGYQAAFQATEPFPGSDADPLDDRPTGALLAAAEDMLEGLKDPNSSSGRKEALAKYLAVARALASELDSAMDSTGLTEAPDRLEVATEFTNLVAAAISSGDETFLQENLHPDSYEEASATQCSSYVRALTGGITSTSISAPTRVKAFLTYVTTLRLDSGTGASHMLVTTSLEDGRPFWRSDCDIDSL